MFAGSLLQRRGFMRKSVLVIAFALVVIESYSQQAAPDLLEDKGGGTGYNMKWDYRAGELIYYRDITAASAPAVRILKVEEGTIPIYPLPDLPGAKARTIWDAAETPEGGVIFSAVAEYGPRNVRPVPVKSLLLTYSRDGRLTKLWDVYPYHHHHIAVDSHGDVYGLGTKDTPRTNYPLLVKYSSDGDVLGEFLPANLFSIGDKVVESGSPNGETEMFANADELFVWSAPTQEILRLSLSGELRARNSLDNALKSLAAQNGSDRAKIIEILPGADGRIIAQIQLRPPEGSSVEFKFAMAAFSADGTEARVTLSAVDGGRPTQRAVSGRNARRQIGFLRANLTAGRSRDCETLSGRRRSHSVPTRTFACFGLKALSFTRTSCRFNTFELRWAFFL